MITYACCRVSTPQQHIERQIRNILAAYPDAIVIKEYYTGTKLKGRKEIERVMQKADKNSRLVFDSVSRMCRNEEEGCEVYEELFRRGVNLVFLKQPHINTDVYRQALERRIDLIVHTGNAATDKFLQSIIDSLNDYIIDLAKEQIRIAFRQAQQEVEFLHQRTREGIEMARLTGKQIGQVPGTKLITKKSIACKAKMEKYCKAFGGTLSDVDCIKLLGIDKNTFYKYKREMLQELVENSKQ